MSHIGSISVLITGTGVNEILDKAFGGIPKMLTGKRYLQNLRALRMLMEELSRPLSKDGKYHITQSTCEGIGRKV